MKTKAKSNTKPESIKQLTKQNTKNGEINTKQKECEEKKERETEK